MTKEKILENYHVRGDCWIWKTGLTTSGYGKVWYEGRHQVAHRVVYGWRKGEIPEGMFVCHHCDTPACINPDHLFLGSQEDNIQDAVLKGRMARMRGGTNGQAKLAEKDVQHIRELLAQNVVQTEIARMYTVHQRTISKINTGKRWRWLK